MADDVKSTSQDTTCDPMVELAKEKALQRRKARRAGEKQWAFTITSLMDAMTILLIFLLVTLTSDPLNVKQDSHLLLARSTAPIDPEDAISITIKKTFIAVDRKEVVRVDCRLPGGAACTEDMIKRRTFCDVHPGKCSPAEIKLLNSMFFYIDKTSKENGDEDSFVIVPLLGALEERVKQRHAEIREIDIGEKFKPIANIICDRDIPLRLVEEVVHTAGVAGLSSMRFAIVKSSRR